MMLILRQMVNINLCHESQYWMIHIDMHTQTKIVHLQFYDSKTSKTADKEPTGYGYTYSYKVQPISTSKSLISKSRYWYDRHMIKYLDIDYRSSALLSMLKTSVYSRRHIVKFQMWRFQVQKTECNGTGVCLSCCVALACWVTRYITWHSDNLRATATVMMWTHSHTLMTSILSQYNQ